MHELGLTYTTKPIGPRTGETKTAEYTKLNPRQKIPLLQDGDFSIGESAAIVAYLSRMYSTTERSLIPETTREYAAWLEWCFFIVAELDSTSLYVMRRHRADALGPIYGIAPEVVAQAGEYFRQQLRHVAVGLADRGLIDRKSGRRLRLPHPPDLRLIELRDDTARDHLFIVDDFASPQDRRAGHVSRVQALQPYGRGVLADILRHLVDAGRGV